MITQTGVRRQNLPERLNVLVRIVEDLARSRVDEATEDRGLELSVGCLRAVGLEILRGGRSDLLVQVDHEDVEILKRALYGASVEGQRLLHVLEHADEVHDQADLLADVLAVDVRPVDACQRLEQHVVAHRLVQVHDVEHRAS